MGEDGFSSTLKNHVVGCCRTVSLLEISSQILGQQWIAKNGLSHPGTWKNHLIATSFRSEVSFDVDLQTSHIIIRIAVGWTPISSKNSKCFQTCLLHGSCMSGFLGVRIKGMKLICTPRRLWRLRRMHHLGGDLRFKSHRELWTIRWHHKQQRCFWLMIAYREYEWSNKKLAGNASFYGYLR